MTNIGAELTALETRLSILEQQSAVMQTPGVSVRVNPNTGAQEVIDSLTWEPGWESWTRIKLGPPLSYIDPSGNPAIHPPAQAIRMGGIAVLTGLVRRTGGDVSTGGVNLRMFTLPTGWRPRWIAMLPGFMSTGAPAPSWIEAKPDYGRPAGGVYYIAGPYVLGNGGWVGLSGAFPCADIP